MKVLKWIGNGLAAAGLGLLFIVSYNVYDTKSQQTERLDAFASIKAEAQTSDGHRNRTEADIPADGDDHLQGMEGVLSIPDIDLKEPVMMGADESVLATGLGSVEHMDVPGGKDGSYAIAGHQSYAFGEFFNRLHELEIGQQFTFETLENILEYEVFDIQIVDPGDVKVLDRQEGKSMMSLITCYPARSDKYRLVVQAKKVN